MDSGSGPGFDDEPPPEPRDGWLLVRIHVPELNVYKCLQFPSDRLVWDVKQQVLASLPKELKESFNYGLFCPPANGKAGKFLDEERRLGDYPFNGPVGYLELKYKRRVYKMLNLDERQLKALHTRANLRRFLECINGGHVEKIAKMCAKGLDPNFHCSESGETPLTVATGAKKPNKLLIALVNGGALLDYRTKDGTTALHRAVEKDSLEAVSTLLELGASPNYKDNRGITPLYISITRKCESKITESLLHDHATLGIQDNQGWNEVHQACRHGLVQHLEHLLFYGADMDGRNASGNTPLHVCAVNNQEACARMLLFRGAQRGALNFANQTPYQVAVIAGNLELAEIIQNYKVEDVVPFRGPPRYNPKRRSGIGWQSVNGSVGVSAGGSLLGTLSRNSAICGQHGPPSPCPSEHMPYSSASSSLSEGSSGHRSHEDDISIVTDKSLGDTSDIISDSSGVGTNSDSAACSIGHPSTTVVCMDPYAGNQSGHIRLQQGDVIEVVGSTDCGLLEGYVRGTNQSGFFPAECVQEVNLRQKNVTNVTVGNQQQLQHPQQQQQQLISNSPQLSIGGSSGIAMSSSGSSSRGGGTLPRASLHAQQQSPSLSITSNGSNNMLMNGGCNTLVKTNSASAAAGIAQYNSSTAPRIKKGAFNEPRTVILHRAKRGFGFILRGAKASSQLMQLKPSERFPALQYLDDVDPGGVADMAGLRPGDFLLAIGNEDVRAASHEKVVDMIRSAGALVSMTVISPQFPLNQMQQQAMPQYLPSHQQHQQLSSGPSTPQSTHRQCATLPRKMSMGPGAAAAHAASGGRQPAPLPPRRDPKTTLSVGRARAKSMVAGLENGGEKDEDELPHTKSSSVESIVTPTPTHPGTPVQLRTASIKARPTSSRITAAELEELFQRQQGEAAAHGENRYSTMMTTSRFQGGGTDSGATTPPANSSSPSKSINTGAPLVYGSVAEMKRKTKNKNGTLRAKPCAIPTVAGSKDLKRFHSTPDLNTHLLGSSGSIWSAVGKGHHSQDDVATLHASLQRLNTLPANTACSATTTSAGSLPPPTHPPPPPPVGQVIKVETRNNSSEYESTLSLQQKLKKRAENDAVTSAAIDGVQSSFNPSANAKIYASPQELRNVMAWKLRQAQEQRSNGSAQSQQAQPQSPQQQKQVPISISPYAQPTTTNCSNSVGSQQQQQQQQQQSETAYAATAANTKLNGILNNSNVPTGPAPPIPDPDYSFSESDGEDENSILVARNTKLNEKIALIDVPETSGNSQASGSSSGSASISHSLSVDEIQRIRSNLKTSKSSPNGFVKTETQTFSVTSIASDGKTVVAAAATTTTNAPSCQNNAYEVRQMPVKQQLQAHEDEADNSSSGVSSDQEQIAAANAAAAAAAVASKPAAKPTDTIKKKPTVTIVEEPKTIPERKKSLEESIQRAAGVNSKQQCQQPNVSNAGQVASNRNSVNTNPTTAVTSVANAAAAFEAKAACSSTTVTITAMPGNSSSSNTVTVKQMVQQQHAPAIQQQQQQMSSSNSTTKVKTLLVQSQQQSIAKTQQPMLTGRIPSSHHQPTQAKQSHAQAQAQAQLQAQRMTAQQQQLILQQQQQQQLAHQQHLQQILKAKAAAAGVSAASTAAIVVKQQQQLHKAASHEHYEHQQRSDHDEDDVEDDGDLSPSPPAQAFQRHNSLTRKQAAAIAMQRATRSAAVSLVQLPPPLEADSDSELSCASAVTAVPAAAHALGNNSNHHQHNSNTMQMVTENIVLAPPPQFCDCNDVKHVPQLQQQHQHQQQQMQQQRQAQQQLAQQQLTMQHLQQLQPQLGMHVAAAAATAAHGAGPGQMGTLGRVRIVGAVPKTQHHRLH